MRASRRPGSRSARMRMSSVPLWRPAKRASVRVRSAPPLRPPPTLANSMRPSMRPAARSPQIAASGASGASSIWALPASARPRSLHCAPTTPSAMATFSEASAASARQRTRSGARVYKSAPASAPRPSIASTRAPFAAASVAVPAKLSGARRKRPRKSKRAAIASAGPSACRLAAATRNSPAWALVMSASSVNAAGVIVRSPLI